MRIFVLHGQSHKGNTHKITKDLISRLSENLGDNLETFEHFIPTEFSHACCGCNNCFFNGEDRCPAYSEVQKILADMIISDIIIYSAPTYVYGIPGHLKQFFDHLGYMWLAHRPDPIMANKVGIVISTAAGSGAKKCTKLLKEQLNWLGISTVYSYAKLVRCYTRESLSGGVESTIDRDIRKLASKISKKPLRQKFSLKVFFMFHLMKFMKKHFEPGSLDEKFWKDNYNI